MSKDHLLTAAFMLFVTSLVIHSHGSSAVTRNEWQPILQSLRHECDPVNPEADYSFVQTALPTERKRAALLQRCLDLGPGLLPLIKDALQHETDEEVRGMLTVFAAALGDKPSIEPAARCMTGHDFPALKITAAKALLPIRDPVLTPWFRLALEDWHFVVNGACGIERERFYPVRSIADQALVARNLIAETDAEFEKRRHSEIKEHDEQLEREIRRAN